ncbi:hypothetical protein [Arthrobacter sp.]|uniref:hypothetical protein n=1 Tax=Arthrobacter sp. TaxID=1667 RepID=UPI003A915BDF
MDSNPYFVTRQRLVQAPPGAIFELLADPSKHPLIDGSGTVKRARQEQPARLSLGAEFGMDMRLGLGYKIRNTVVEFEEARVIAWRHFNGHRWRYELTPAPRGTLVRETWDASRLKRQWPLKVLGFTRTTPVNIERTLERLADYFDPETPRPTDPEPSKRTKKATPATPAEAAQEEARKQARLQQAQRADAEAAAAQAAKAERATRTAQTRAERRAEWAARAAVARQARAERQAAKVEKVAQAQRAAAEKAAEAERVQAAKAEAAAQAERARVEKAAREEQARAEKAARLEQEQAAKKRKHEQAQAARKRKHEPEVPVEPMPPIGATARPLASAPVRPAREAIAAAKAGRWEKPKPKPKPKAQPAPAPALVESEPGTTPAPVRTGLPPAAARRLRRAS